MGIYQIRNLANGKIFVESSKNLTGAQNSCKFQLDLGSHTNKSLQGDYAQLGEKQFVFEILDQLKPKDDAPPGYDYAEDLSVLKAMWLEKLQPYGVY